MGPSSPLSARIRRAREAADLTQAQLAAAVGVAEKTVRNWEAGRHPRRSLGAVEEVLGVDLTAEHTTTPSVALADATDAQLMAEQASRLADRARQLADLESRRDREVAARNAELAQLRDGTPTDGRWAARVREP